MNDPPCLFDTRAITGEGPCYTEREGSPSMAADCDCNNESSDGQQSTFASPSGRSSSHHCTSNFLGNVLDPVNNLNVSDQPKSYVVIDHLQQ